MSARLRWRTLCAIAVSFVNLECGAQSVSADAPSTSSSTSGTPAKTQTKPPLTIEPDLRASSLRRVSSSDYIARIVLKISNPSVAVANYSLRMSMPKKRPGLQVQGITSSPADHANVELQPPFSATLSNIAISKKDISILPAGQDQYDIQISFQCASDVKDCWQVDTGADKQPTASAEFSLDLGTTATTKSVTLLAGKLPEGRDNLGFGQQGINDLLKDDRISQSGLVFETSIIKKALADELFLQSTERSRVEAGKKYGEALQLASAVFRDAKAEPQTKADAKLLIAEINYRTTLLKAGLGFWGGYISQVPGIPIRHLAALEDLFADFEKVLNQIDGISATATATDQELLKARASLQELNGKLATYLIDRDKATIVQQKERRNINDTWSNMATIEEQQVRIKAKMDELAAQQAALTSKTNSLLTKAVTASAGIDPSLLEAVRSGDVKSVAASYIQSQIGSPDSPLMKSFGDLTAESQKMVQLYQQVHEGTIKAEELRSNFEAAAEAIRHPTVDSIGKLGEQVWAKLPDNAKLTVLSTINDKVPAIEWARSASDTLKTLGKPDDYLAGQIADVLQQSGTPVADLKNLIHNGITQAYTLDADARLGLQSILGGVISSSFAVGTNAAQAEAALNGFATAMPEAFLERIPPQAKLLLQSEMGAANQAQVADRLRVYGLSKVKVIFDVTGNVTVAATGVANQVSFARSELLKPLTLSGDVEKIQADAERFLYDAAAGGSAGMRTALSFMPPTVLMSGLAAKNSSQAVALSASLKANLPPADFKSVQERIAKSMVGYASIDQASQAISEQTQSAAPRRAIEEDSKLPQGGGLDPQTNQMLTVALDAAFPGAGTALQMVQAFGAMDANRDLNEKLSQEAARLMAKKVELIDRQTNTYFDEVLSQKDQARAEALADAARQQITQYQQVMQRSIEERGITEAKIGLRRGWTFYLAERLREEFDLFDRAYALWAKGAAKQGVVEEEIRNDPQNTRYALDSDIQLYGWLSRTRESSRSDPDTLRIHWARLIRLAKDLCQRRGCKPGDAMLGQIASGRQLSVIDDLLSAADRAKFLAWQEKPLGVFRADFTILPFQQFVPSSLDNVRIIEVRASLLDRAGGEQATDQITLRHRGVSYIPRLTRGATGESVISLELENMLPRSSNSFNRASEYDLESLRTRYDSYFTGSNLPSARIFEGYGLFASYEIIIEPTPQNIKAKDIALRFAYHYNDASIVMTEAQFIQSIVGSGRNSSSDGLDIALVEDRGLCSKFPPTTPRKISNLPLATQLFFLPRSNKQFAALSDGQRKSIEQLALCGSATLRKICRSDSDIALSIDTQLRGPEGEAVLRRNNPKLKALPIDALRLELIKDAKNAASKDGCKGA